MTIILNYLLAVTIGAGYLLALYQLRKVERLDLPLGDGTASPEADIQVPLVRPGRSDDRLPNHMDSLGEGYLILRPAEQVVANEYEWNNFLNAHIAKWTEAGIVTDDMPPSGDGAEFTTDSVSNPAGDDQPRDNIVYIENHKKHA